MASDRDVEKTYPLPEFIAELRRLADALEAGERFEIELDGETIVLPEDAVVSIEHEREDGSEELEFQIRWGALEEVEEDDDEGEDDEEAPDGDGEGPKTAGEETIPA